MAKRSVAEITTPNGALHLPADTPPIIVRALQVAASTQFCRFLTDVLVTNNGEYAVEA